MQLRRTKGANRLSDVPLAIGSFEGKGGCGDRATALIEDICCEKIRGCSCGEAVRPTQYPLPPHSDQVPQRSEMTRCANARRSLVIGELAFIPGTRAEARVYRSNVSSTFRAATRSTISCLVSKASMMARRRGSPTWAHS